MTVSRVAFCLLFLPVAGFGVAHAQEGKVVANSIGMKLAPIPAGKFMMGSPASEEERDAEELQHEVEISRPFYLGVHEVTQSQFERMMLKDKNPSFFSVKNNNGGPDHPVDQVQWALAVEFCQKLSALPEEMKAGRVYRLPTEAEWEYACRAGTTTPFHFGKSVSSKQANFNGNFPYGGAAKGQFLERTAKVGSYEANAWGLFDMHGNVWEWCADWYNPDYYKGSPKVDPKGPDKGVLPTGFRNQFFKTVRGGCWLDEARGCRSAYRFRLMPDERYRWVGFRVACEIAAPKSAERLEDLKRRTQLAEMDVELWSDRAGWSQRIMLRGLVSPNQFAADAIRRLDAEAALKRLRDELHELSKQGDR